MRTKSKSPAVLLTLVAALFGVSPAGLAQPGISVSPSVTSNSYTGFITLNITGLNNGEQVVVQKWLDLNGNGLIDAGEPMVDAFNLTDGGAMTIGGVTNLSVPFDSNPATGAITATLNFTADQVLENMVGHFVYRVTSPSQRFAPVTATFAVTNAVTTQSLRGTVYNNGVPVPNAVVVAQDQQANNPAGATVADSNGNYSLSLPPGGYALIPALPNCYYDESLAPSATLTNGMSATNNLYLTNGTVTILGNVQDAGNSNGIGGLLLTLQSGNFFAIAFTDTNGNYSAALTPSFWKIQVDKQRLTRRAYVFPEATFQVDATGGPVSGANIALPRGNALFYGRITDNANTPYANIEADGSAGNNYDAKGYSDANGNYAVAVLGDLTNQWSCGVNSGKNTPLASYVLNVFNTTSLAPGQTVQQIFVALPATGLISGHVQDNLGNPVSGVTLDAGANIDGNNYLSLDGTTDSSGNYSLAVASGQWSVQFLTGGSSDTLDAHGFVDLSAPHFLNIPPTNQTLNLTVYPFGTPIITSPQRISATQFGFTLNGASNVNYTVQISTNLASTNWTSLFSLQLTNNSSPIVDMHATNSARFYRVQKN